jgi:hypothetical protein
MHQELDPHRLPRILHHGHRPLHPDPAVATLMEESLQNGAVGIGDVGVLPVVLNSVSGTRQVPERQRAVASRNGELLIERAVSGRLTSKVAKGLW